MRAMSLLNEMAERTASRIGDSDAVAETAVRSEDLLIRNYDGEAPHGVTIWIAGDGTVLNKHYRVEPGETTSELDELDPGRYRIVVEVDDERRVSETCELTEEPTAGLIVEMGNGIVSVSETH